MKIAKLLKLLVAASTLAAGSAAFAADDAAAESEAAEASGPFSWIQMPKVTMPSVTMPKIVSNPLAPFKAGAKKVGDGTKKAWEGTKEIFSGGDKDADRNAPPTTADAKPSMWKRMFGGEEEPKQPATIPEWMAQARPE